METHNNVTESISKRRPKQYIEQKKPDITLAGVASLVVP